MSARPISRRTALRYIGAAALAAGCASPSDPLTIYCAQDQVYAEPLFREFRQQSGIEVSAIFDSEMVKAVGLANRLIAEKNYPQANLFWNNEPLRSYQLAHAGVVDWQVRKIGYRSRRIVVNTKRLSIADAPKDWLELSETKWAGKIAMAYPLFGTTATHFIALQESLGHSAWIDWCQRLAKNNPLLVDGNSIVVKLVADGEAIIGMTDSDDIEAAIKNGLPVAALPLSAHSLLLPNTLAVIPNWIERKATQEFINFLTQPETIARLVSAGALEGASISQASHRGLQVDWQSLATQIQPATEILKEIFLRA